MGFLRGSTYADMQGKMMNSVFENVNYIDELGLWTQETCITRHNSWQLRLNKLGFHNKQQSFPNLFLTVRAQYHYYTTQDFVSFHSTFEVYSWTRQEQENSSMRLVWLIYFYLIRVINFSLDSSLLVRILYPHFLRDINLSIYYCLLIKKKVYIIAYGSFFIWAIRPLILIAMPRRISINQKPFQESILSLRDPRCRDWKKKHKEAKWETNMC